MHRRKALRMLASLLLSAALPAAATKVGNERASAEKGWAGGGGNAVRTFGASWDYTWWHSGDDVTGSVFVPMIKHDKDIGQTSALKGRNGIQAVLGFSEPEHKSQGETSNDKAIKLWPKPVGLAAEKNIRSGSPAASSDKAGMDWLTEFMRRARKDKLRVDFIAIHWYRSRDASAFGTWLKELDRNWCQAALKSLERPNSGDRYAYFEPGKGKEHSLFKADGTLSRMGELYRDAGT